MLFNIKSTSLTNGTPFLPVDEVLNPSMLIKFKYTNVEGNTPTYSVHLIQGEEDVEITSDVTIDTSAPLVIQIPHIHFVEGLNTIKITFTDSVASGDDSTIKSTEWTYPVVAESKDSEEVIRDLGIDGDYTTVGDASINPTEKLTVKSEDAVAKGIAIGKKSISMDGHSKINKIEVTAQTPEAEDVSITISPIKRENMGEYICETYSLEQLKEYSNITSLTLSSK